MSSASEPAAALEGAAAAAAATAAAAAAAASTSDTPSQKDAAGKRPAAASTNTTTTSSTATTSSSYRAYQPIRPAASLMLAKKWDEHTYDMHRRKLNNTKARIDNQPPKNYTHLQVKLQIEEERMATVERDNRALLKKMTHIMKTSGRVDNHNDYQHKSLNKSKRQQELNRIAQDNQAILKRIASRQPHYDRKAWERDFDRSTQLKAQITRYPNPTPGRAETDAAEEGADQQTVVDVKAPAPQYETDISDEPTPTAAEPATPVAAN